MLSTRGDFGSDLGLDQSLDVHVRQDLLHGCLSSISEGNGRGVLDGWRRRWGGAGDGSSSH